jgi:hypothetical protein
MRVAPVTAQLAAARPYRKHHRLVDTLGLLVAVHMTPPASVTVTVPFSSLSGWT